MPTSSGDEVECELVVHAALPQPGMSWARDGRAIVALRPEVAAALECGDLEAQRVALHELAHVMFDLGAVPDSERERRANLFAEAALWLLGRG